jgi:multiple sugar transport system permease protein
MNNSMRRWIGFFKKPEGAAYLFILPAFAVFVVFVFVPLLSSLGISFLRMDLFMKRISFVGLANYRRLLIDARFWNALGNTLYFTSVEVAAQIVVALFTAACLKGEGKFASSMRSLFFLPYVCSLTAVGIVWSMLLDPTLGLAPYCLKLIGIEGISFLKDPNLAMPSIIAMTVWKNFGFSMIILVAGMQSISTSYYEAAEIDGAGRWTRFYRITLPLLVPTLGFCLITNTIGSLQVFDQAYVMTQGGPLRRTETIVQYVYYRGFRLQPYDLGYASAIAEALFVLIAAVSLAMYAVALRKETVES